MASLVVGGVSIKVSRTSGDRSRIEAVDRSTSLDNTYRTSRTGGARRQWHFQTPPVLGSVADSYKAILASPAAQMCSGDILVIPTMCCAELTGGTSVATPAGRYETVDFLLHEVQPSTVLLKYAPGDVISGVAFTRATTATYRNAVGNVATAAIDTLRSGHYDISDLTANSPSVLLEDARTNIALWNRDLTNAAWTKTNMTVTKNQIGADGAVNGACALVATAANATVTQAVVLASSQRAMSAYVFRGVGSGPVQMTTDGGATWTTITLGAVGFYSRYSIPAQTLANPNFGFRIVTNGDAIGVDFVQNENGAFATSAIPTTTVAVTRAADLLSFPFTTPPQEMTVYAKFIERGTINTSGAVVFHVSNAATASPALAVYAPGVYTAAHQNGATVTSGMAVAPVYNDTVELIARLYGDGSVQITQSINGGAETTATQSAALALAAAWSGLLFWPNGASGGSRGFTAIRSLKAIAGSRSLAEMRTL